MRIKLYRYQLPLTMPLLIHGRSVAMREGFYVQIEQHWGEIAPPLHADMKAVEQDLTAAVTRLRQGRPHGAQWSAVQFGLDCAQFKVSHTPSLVGQTASLPLSLPLLEGPRDPLLRAWRCRRVHPNRAWLSLTGDVHYDASLVRELCLLAPTVRLVLDAAGRLGSTQILDLWSRIDARRIDWLLDASGELTAAQALAEQHSIPLAFDLARYPNVIATNGFNSASGFTSPRASDLVKADLKQTEVVNLALSKLTFARAIILRPAALGGLAHNQMLATQARAFGLEVMVGDSLQTGLGQQQLAHLSSQWLGDAPLALGRCRYLLESGIDELGQPKMTGLTPL